MSLLRRSSKTADEPDTSDESVADRSSGDVDARPNPARSPGKGRPTPKRREAERVRRGPVAPPPRTQREAIKRSKTASKSLSKEERRKLTAQRRERMMRGDNDYLLARDKGEIRAWVRDQVDARRNLAGLLMPLAILSFVVLILPNPYIQTFGPMVLLIAILAAVADGVVLGRKLSREVRQVFPKGDGTKLSTTGRALGFYAFNRAVMPRRWRVPRSRVPKK